MAHLPDAHNAPIAEFVPELDQLAVDAMGDWKVPGAALAVVQDGKVALAKAYGQRNIEADLPVTTATQFLICSITKSFTATAASALGVGRSFKPWLGASIALTPTTTMRLPDGSWRHGE